MTEWLRQSEAAVYLEVNQSDLSKLRDVGEGPVFYKKGPLIRYKQEDLDSWVEQEFASAVPTDEWDRVEPGKSVALPAQPTPDGPVDPHDIFAGGPEYKAPEPPQQDPIVSGIPCRDPELFAGIPPHLIGGVDMAPSRLLDPEGGPAGESPLAIRGETREVPGGGE